MARKFTSTFVHVTIERGENEHIATTVLAHEIPCLLAKHGEGSVKVVTDIPKDVLDYQRIGEKLELDREEEWGRLMSKYGMHPNFDAETVVYVYQNDKIRMTKFDLDEFIADSGAVENSENIEAMLDMLDDMGVEVESERPGKVESLLREVLCEKLDDKGVDYRSNDDIKVLMAVANAVLPMTVAKTVGNAIKNAVGGGKSKVDEDGDGDITVKEIKEKLDAIEVDYNKSGNKAYLYETLEMELKLILEENEVPFEEEEPAEVLWSKYQDYKTSKAA